MPETTGAPKPQHKATYARDKRKGGYNVRVVGPYPEKFAGRIIPVSTQGGDVHDEKLIALLWTGVDLDPQNGVPTGKQAALYSFEPRPRDAAADELPF